MFDNELLGGSMLEGAWGDPKATEPIQVDLIDLETDSDIVSIEVFNRAIALGQIDFEEVQRINTACDVLEAAASDSPDRSAELAPVETAVPIFQFETVPPSPATIVDMSGVLKEHRRQGGACALCGDTMTRAGALKHLASCPPAHDKPKGISERLLQIRAVAPPLPAYWLDLEVKADVKLEALDRFLRQLWVECCGHLSMFRIGAVNYFSRGYELGMTGPFATLGRRQPAERSMGAKVGDVWPRVGVPVAYEYDFGSTTILKLSLMAERMGRPGRTAVRLLARNTSPLWPCASCGQPAAWVCTYCFQEEGAAFVCATHLAQHDCGEQEGFLPVVNSPGMGVCGYTAQT